MSGSIPRLYWDTNCFIKYLEKDPVWFPTLDTLLYHANKAGTIMIVTSVLTITELAFTEMERLNRALDPAEEARLDRFWATSPGVLQVEFNGAVGRLAREIRRDDIMVHKYRAKNFADLIHVATARYAGAAEVNSIDGDVLRYNTRYGLLARKPFVKLVRLPNM